MNNSGTSLGWKTPKRLSSRSQTFSTDSAHHWHVENSFVQNLSKGKVLHFNLNQITPFIAFSYSANNDHIFTQTPYVGTINYCEHEIRELLKLYPLLHLNDSETYSYAQLFLTNGIRGALLISHIDAALKYLEVKSIIFESLEDEFAQSVDFYLVFNVDPSSRSSTDQFISYIDNFLSSYDPTFTGINVSVV